MTDGKYAKLARTVVITGGAFVVNLLIQLLLTPYITRRAGTEGASNSVSNSAASTPVIRASRNSDTALGRSARPLVFSQAMSRAGSVSPSVMVRKRSEGRCHGSVSSIREKN